MTASSSAVEGLDLDGLRAKAEKATPGPWTWNAHELSGGSFDGGDYGEAITRNNVSREKLYRSEDADFIAATDPSTVLALIARVEAAEAAVARVRKLLDPGPRSVRLRRAAARESMSIAPSSILRALDGTS